jgi:hypothetical protein
MAEIRRRGGGDGADMRGDMSVAGEREGSSGEKAQLKTEGVNSRI